MTHDEYIKRRDEAIQKHNNFLFKEFVDSPLYRADEMLDRVEFQQAIDALVLAVIGRCDGGHSDWEVQNQCDIENDLRTDQRSIVKGGE